MYFLCSLASSSGNFPSFCFTHWLAKAWKDYTENCQEEITNAFKRCGQYNDMNGRENDLVKMQGVPDCKPPAKGEGRKPNLIPSDRITLEKNKKLHVFPGEEGDAPHIQSRSFERIKAEAQKFSGKA